MPHSYECFLMHDGLPDHISHVSVLTRTQSFTSKYTHSNYHINIITSGSITMKHGKKSVFASSGSAVLLPAGLQHTIESKDGYSQIGIRLSREQHSSALANRVFDLFSDSIEVLSLGAGESEYNYVKQAVLDNDEISKMYLSNRVEKLFIDLVSAAEKRSTGFRSRFLDFISRIDPCKLTFSDVLENLSYSKSHLERLMNENFGMGVSEYLRKLRISIAQSMLKESDLPIYAIAEQTGFYDSAHFIREFKRNCGCSPQKYRNEFIHNKSTSKESKND